MFHVLSEWSSKMWFWFWFYAVCSGGKGLGLILVWLGDILEGG